MRGATLRGRPGARPWGRLAAVAAALAVSAAVTATGLGMAHADDADEPLTLAVNTADDDPDADCREDEEDGDEGEEPDCSLRGAVERAVSDDATSVHIDIPADTYELTADRGALDIADDADLDELTLQGTGNEGGTSIAAPDADRIVRIDGDQVAIELIDLRLTGGAPSSGPGGAVAMHADGALALTRTQLVDNAAGDDASGGAVFAQTASVTISDSMLSRNSAPDLNGQGGAVRAVEGDVTVSGSRITENDSGAAGGGISTDSGDVTVIDAVISGNVNRSIGGGIYNDSGTVEIRGSIVDDNAVSSRGAGILAGEVSVVESTISDNDSFGQGGGIDGSDVEIVRSTLVDNHANDDGGAIAVVRSGSLDLRATTISGNSGNGAIYIGSLGVGSDAVLHQVTLADNASGGDGVDLVADDEEVALTGTLLASSATSDGAACAVLGSGEVISDGHNLATDGSCGLGEDTDLEGVDDPGIGALADNGGATDTHALDDDSPAVDAGPDECDDTDQRGVERPQGQACDIGAYELDDRPEAPADITIEHTIGVADDVTVDTGIEPADITIEHTIGVADDVTVDPGVAPADITIEHTIGVADDVTLDIDTVPSLPTGSPFDVPPRGSPEGLPRPPRGFGR